MAKGCFPILLLLGSVAYGGYYWYDSSQTEELLEIQAADERAQLLQKSDQLANELSSVQSDLRVAEAKAASAEERARVAEENARQLEARIQKIQSESEASRVDALAAMENYKARMEAAEKRAEDMEAKLKETESAFSRTLAALSDAPSDPSPDDTPPAPLITADDVRAYVQARADGDLYEISSMFADTVQYKYSDFRNVSRSTVLDDIQAGWKRWVYRTYNLESVGINGSRVEVVYRYQLKESNGRKSATGYTKEIWELDSNGKIYYWNEELSKKKAPSLSSGMKRLF